MINAALFLDSSAVIVGVVFLGMPLYGVFGDDYHELFDGLWIIQSTCEVSKQRLVETRGMTEKEALIRIRAQDTRLGIGRM